MQGDQVNSNNHKGAVIDAKDGYNVIDCRTCRFIHVIPLPTEKELSKLYKESFYSHAKPRYFQDMEEDREWWMAHYQNHYNLFAKYVKGKRVLDIGSGPGHFLQCGKELGWDVIGLEPSRKATAYARKLGITVVNSLFSESALKPYGPFDVVYLYLVLEHIPHPIPFLQEVRKVLKQGGILCIISPNDYNPLQRILRDHLGYDPWWLAPPQHINYFTFDSMKALLKRLRFTILEMTATFPMEFFLLAGENYVGKRRIGRNCHKRRKTFELTLFNHAPDMLNTFYRSLASNNIGREFVILGKKDV